MSRHLSTLNETWMRVAVLVMWPAINSSPTSRRGSHRRSRDRRSFGLPAAGQPVVPRRLPRVADVLAGHAPDENLGVTRTGRAVRVRPLAAVTGGARQRLR